MASHLFLLISNKKFIQSMSQNFLFGKNAWGIEAQIAWVTHGQVATSGKAKAQTLRLESFSILFNNQYSTGMVTFRWLGIVKQIFRCIRDYQSSGSCQLRQDAWPWSCGCEVVVSCSHLLVYYSHKTNTVTLGLCLDWRCEVCGTCFILII